MRNLSFRGEWFESGMVIALNIQGPHDILMAEVQVVTPAGIHTLVLQDGNRHTGTFREWDREHAKLNNYQKRLLEMWKQERSWEKSESSKWCMRGHRTTQEAKTCNGTVKPVFELSDPPRVVPRSSGTKKASYRLRPRGETYLSYNMRKNNQKYVPIAPKPKTRSMGKVYHFKAATSNPRATVQMHPIPEASVVKHERLSSLQAWPTHHPGGRRWSSAEPLGTPHPQAPSLPESCQ